jgi:hypothetical protein
MRRTSSWATWTFLLAAVLWLVPAGGLAAQEKRPPRRALRSHAAVRHASVRAKNDAAPAHGGRPDALKNTALSALSKSGRDPFAPLISDAPGKTKRVVRPPGKAGLVIDEIQVQGTVRGPHGAVAVVSAPGGHVYFLRAGDKLFDGKVERIELKGVEFIEHARDALGRAFDRRVVKAVQPPAGVRR